MRSTYARFLAIAVFAAFSQTASAQSPPIEWLRCNVDSDCVFVKNSCTENMDLNVKYADAYNKLMASSKPLCPKPEPRMKDAMAACMKGMCVEVLPYQ